MNQTYECGLIYFEYGKPEKHHECGKRMPKDRSGWTARRTETGFVIYVCPEHGHVGIHSKYPLQWWLNA